MKSQTPLKDRKYQRRQKAIALVIVLAMVSMMTIFMLAIFSVSRTEHTSSVKYADGQNAKELADMAVNVVMAQIWDGTARTTTNQAIWASQPGAIRKYALGGNFIGGYKLYSSNQMQVLGGAENLMLADATPADWAAQNGIYTDLNEPVIRPDADGDGNPEIVYPIIDPRAYIPGQANLAESPNVEGFWYNENFAGVVPAVAIADINSRLPMPVQWLYILKNGMLGTMEGSGNALSFVPATSAAENQATEDNPIVGRMAFWTDDETSKININTAGEPTPWATPVLMHERDLWFAHFQPMSHEYQRFPGHPATVALSSVLFPNQDMDIYGKTPGSALYRQILQRKERIYEVMPKLHTGGSKAGTIAYWRAVDITQLSQLEQSVDLTNAIRERLYASVDDLMFAQRLAAGRRLMQDDPRVLNTVGSLAGADAAVPLFSTPGQLERARFFLTAHSRMPEVNMYGYPRVAIWPVADESLGADRRTGFDNLIAFCSSLGATPAARQSNSYFFRRARYDSATFDINLPRNQALLTMLNNTLGTRVMPGGGTFASKYNQGDSTQILVQIFDYIRSTNLYDGFLAPTKQQMIGDGSQASGDPRFRWETYDNNGTRSKNSGIAAVNQGGHADAEFYINKPDHRTFTPDRLSRWTGGRGVSGQTRAERAIEYTFPGHGSVVPSEYQNGEFRGLGRFPTITEVGFQFICTADGNPDKGSFRMMTPDGSGGFTKVPWPGADAAASTWTAQSPNFQGGRTAVRMQVHTGFGVGQAIAERAPAGTVQYLPNEPLFWYSNFPPRPIPGAYGTDPNAALDSPRHPNNHPGFNPRNQNLSLPTYRPDAGNLQQVSPLRPGMKRVQGMLNLEICVPAVGYGPVHPEFTLVVSGLRDMQLDGTPLFNVAGNGTIVWRTGRELYHVSDSIGTVTAGGYVDGASMAADRRVRLPNLPPDPGYDVTSNTGTFRGLRNYDLVTRFVTVDKDFMEITGPGITIEVYAGLNFGGANRPIQTIRIPALGNVRVPPPELVTMSTDHRDQPNANGNRITQRAIHAPEWWSFSWAGVFKQGDFFVGGRFRNPTGQGNDRVSLDINSPGGGNVPRGNALVYGYDNLSSNHNSLLLVPYNGFRRQSDGATVEVLNDILGDDCADTGLSDRRGASYENTGTSRDGRGQDVLFSILSRHGDPRHVLAKKVVPESDWMPHPKLRQLYVQGRPSYFAHNISRANSNANPGYDRGTNVLRLVPNVNYNAAKVPDIPADQASIALASKYGDFDNGPAGTRDGGWINKPDEGNAGVAWFSQNNATRRVPTAYYQEEDRGADAGSSYMTPNRMIPSPVMFGSLPSRVKGGEPWRTLLFRPNVARVANPAQRHPGGPGYYGGQDPADHYILDLFWMPVVEPYAISETFSSAGKVNLNYQIVPFQHITRSTALHAALKGEIMTAVPSDDGANYLTFPSIPANAPARAGEVTRADQNIGQDYHFRQPWSDFQNNLYAGNPKHWHRKIEVERRTGAIVQGTLSQFESRFRFTANPFTPAGSLGLFRTASQICEVHLIPRKIAGSPNIDGGDVSPSEPYTPLNMNNMNVSQNAFWGRRQLTGDNVIERVYGNIYAKVTTQSNTFRVYYKAQTIRKARSVAPNQFDPARDRVASEYRGTTLIERKLDANDPNLPNYTNGGAQIPLDNFYRFRVLETKRFAP